MYLLPLLASAVMTVLRLTSVIGWSWWVVVAPALLVPLAWFGTYALLRIDYRRREG